MENFLIFFLQKDKTVADTNEVAKRVNAYNQWMEMIPENRVSEARLKKEGKSVTKRKSAITEGPYTEATEMIAGYLLIKANNLGEATELCKDAPFLEFFDMEIRPLFFQEGVSSN